MFKFFKDKIKGAISSFSKDVDDTAEEIVEEQKEPPKEVVQKKSPIEHKSEKQTQKKAPFDKKPKKTESSPTSSTKTTDEKEEVQVESKKEKIVTKNEIVQEKSQDLDKSVTGKEEAKVVEEKKEEVLPIADEKPQKKGFFSKFTDKITKKRLTLDQFEELFFQIEIILLENNVAVEVIEKLKEDLKAELVDNVISRSEIAKIVQKTLYESISEVLTFPKVNILSLIETKKPYVISFVGVNGSGKTTHLAKLVHLLQKQNKTCVIAACDTFRAAAIQQIQEHAKRLDVKCIAHDYGADATAVAFDAVAHAKAKNIDVVLIDTAGRLHSNSNLMGELEKLQRVIKPDFTFFVGESITGNDCVEQALQFNEVVPISGIILSKADVDEKGGAALSVSYMTKKPIVYFGTGQTYDDLEEFEKEKVLANIGLSEDE